MGHSRSPLIHNTAFQHIGMNKTTRRIDPKTPRGLYLRLKRDGLGAVLSGQA